MDNTIDLSRSLSGVEANNWVSPGFGSAQPTNGSAQPAVTLGAISVLHITEHSHDRIVKNHPRHPLL